MPNVAEKEILNQLFPEDEKTDITLMEAEPELRPEVESLIQKVEKEIYLSKPITDDAGQTVVASPSTQVPSITLPVSKTTYTFGLTQKVTDSVRWLAEWCLRIIKILGSKAVFREDKIENKLI